MLTKKKNHKHKNNKYNEEKKWWNGLGVILSTLGVVFSIIVSLFIIKQTDTINKQLEIRSVKDKAEAYFEKGQYKASLEEYLKLKKLDFDDKSGYWNFFDKACADSSNIEKRQSVILWLDYAKKIDSTETVNILINKYGKKG